MASISGIKAGRAFIVIDAVDNTGKVLTAVGKKLRAWGRSLQALGREAIFQSFFAGLGGGIVLKEFRDFDDMMRRLGARSRGTGAELEDIRMQARALGKDTAYTAGQVAKLQLALSEKGFSRKDILNITPAAANLGLAFRQGIEDPGEAGSQAAQLIGATLRMFNMDATQSTKVADTFASVMSRTGGSLDDFIVMMRYSGKVAEEFGTDLNELVAMLGMLTRMNIEAESAGTAMRNIYLELSDRSGLDKFNEELKKLTGNTIKFTDQHDNLLKIPVILAAMSDAMAKLGTQAKGDLLRKVFGKRVLIPSLILGGGSDELSILLKSIKRGGGLTKSIAEGMETGVGGAFREFKSGLQDLAIQIGTVLETAIINLLRAADSAVNSFTRWIAVNRKFVMGVVLALTSLAAYGVSLWTIGLSLRMLATPFTALGVLVSLLTTSLSTLSLTLGTFGRFLGRMIGLGNTVVISFAPLVNLFGRITWAVLSLGGSILMGVQGLMNLLGVYTPLLMGWARGAMAVFMLLFSPNFLTAWAALITITTAISAAVIAVGGLGLALQDLVQLSGAVASAIYSSLANVFGTVTSTVTNFISTAISSIQSFISEAFTALWSTLVQFFSRIGAHIVNIGNLAAGGFSAAFEQLAQGDLNTAFELLKSTLVATWAEMAFAVVDTWDQMMQPLYAMWKNFGAFVTSTIANLRANVEDWLLSTAESGGVLGNMIDLVLGQDVGGDAQREIENNRQILDLRKKQLASGEITQADYDQSVKNLAKSSMDTVREQEAKKWQSQSDDAWKSATDAIDADKAARKARLDGIRASADAAREELERKKRVAQNVDDLALLNTELDPGTYDPFGMEKPDKGLLGDLSSALGTGGLNGPDTQIKAIDAVDRSTVEGAKHAYNNFQNTNVQIDLLQKISENTGRTKEEIEMMADFFGWI